MYFDPPVITVAASLFYPWFFSKVMTETMIYFCPGHTTSMYLTRDIFLLRLFHSNVRMFKLRWSIRIKSLLFELSTTYWIWVLQSNMSCSIGMFNCIFHMEHSVLSNLLKMKLLVIGHLIWNVILKVNSIWTYVVPLNVLWFSIFKWNLEFWSSTRNSSWICLLNIIREHQLYINNGSNPSCAAGDS